MHAHNYVCALLIARSIGQRRKYQENVQMEEEDMQLVSYKDLLRVLSSKDF